MRGSLYREIRKKEDIVEYEDDKIFYSQYMAFVFDDEQTNKDGRCDNGRGVPCSLDDEVAVLNLVLAGTAPMLEGLLALDLNLTEIVGPDIELPPAITWDFIKKIIESICKFVDEAIQDDAGNFTDDIVTRAKVGDLLFGGTSVGTIDALFTGIDFLIDTLNPLLPGIDLPHAMDVLGPILPDMLEGGKLALFNGRNGTKLNQWFLINNGRYEPEKFLRILEYNDQQLLPREWWPDAGPTPSANASGVTGTCRDIIGTDGTQYSPFVHEQDLWMFVPDLCRSMWVEYYGKSEVRGIDTLLYKPGENLFNMSYPPNFCFCPEFNKCAKPMEDRDEWDMTECKKGGCRDGLLKVGGCFDGAPVIMSAPHFLRGEEQLIDAIDGINPNYDEHDTILEVEPNIGIPLAAHKRIQVNVDMKHSDLFTYLKNIDTDYVFPVLWVDEGAELDDHWEKKYKNLISRPTVAVEVISIMFMVVGPLMVVVGILLKCWTSRQRDV